MESYQKGFIFAKQKIAALPFFIFREDALFSPNDRYKDVKFNSLIFTYIIINESKIISVIYMQDFLIYCLFSKLISG